MNYAYDLYDALIGINVPTERARAVVKAVEERMTADLATKTDLADANKALRGDIAQLRNEFEQLRHNIERDMTTLRAEMNVKMAEMEARLTLKLGSIVFAAAGLVIAAIKLPL
jgi:outer membrane protein TolC